MRLKFFVVTVSVLGLGVIPGRAQVSLNSVATRVVGHPRYDPIRPTPDTASPNLVEGRELNAPSGVAVDLNATPFPVIYVSDTNNNRVLGWQYKASLGDPGSGKFPPADYVIGQKDLFSTLPQGPSNGNSTGLALPSGLAVDSRGNLFVVDSGNNRIVRYPKPYDPAASQGAPLVIGQTSLNSGRPNFNGISEKSLFLGNLPSAILFDSQGNLYAADPGNNRVLRYSAGDLNAGVNGPSATLVLGQTSFFTGETSNIVVGSDNLPVKDKLNHPVGLALDSRGRLYVSDALQRVLVYNPPSANGAAAARVMGLVASSSAATRDRDNRTRMVAPQGMFVTSDDRLGVTDTALSRITIFPPFTNWPAENPNPQLPVYSPPADFVLGQESDFEVNRSDPNHKNPEPSNTTLSFPLSATLTKNNELFIADTSNNRVLIMPLLSQIDRSVATRVLGQDQFNYASPNLIEGREFWFAARQAGGIAVNAGMVIDQNSTPPHLYIADTFNNRILGFNDARKVKPGVAADLVLGQPDMNRGICNFPHNDPDQPENNSLCNPAGLALDFDGNLWVADSGNARVLRFPNPFVRQGFMPAADIVLGQPDFKTRAISPSNMASPIGIALDGDSRVAVSDAAYNRVLVFERAGGTFGSRPTRVLGQPDFSSITRGASLNQMSSPQLIAIDSSGYVYVADSGNNRVLIFPSPVILRNGDSALDISLTGLSNPNGVFVSQATGEIWVSDTGRSLTRRFPKLDDILLGNNRSTLDIQAPFATVAATQDQFGNLYVADATNRVAIHYPKVIAVNSANYLVSNSFLPRAVAPGSLASICPDLRTVARACQDDDTPVFGDQLASSADLPNQYPLPRELADLQVLLNGEAVPLVAVTPRQINFQVPRRVDTSGFSVVEVVRKSTGQTVASGVIDIRQYSLALFKNPDNISTTAPGSPDPCLRAQTGSGVCYQALANNPDGSINSPSSPVGRGSVITLFGTGQGYIEGGPEDGEVSPEGVSTSWKPRVIINVGLLESAPECRPTGDDPQPCVQFSGLAPGQVGVWMLKVKVPDSTPPTSVLVVAIDPRNNPSEDQTKFRTTIAVKQSQ